MLQACYARSTSQGNSIQVLTCYVAEMCWSSIMHEQHAYSQTQGNIIKHIRQDVSRQSFQKLAVGRTRQPLW